MNIGDLLWKMDYRVSWDEDGHFIKETIWKAYPCVILSIGGGAVITNRGSFPISKIGTDCFSTREECLSAFGKPLHIDGPVIHTVPDRKIVGRAFSGEYMVPRKGTQILIGDPYESHLPNSDFFGDRNEVSLKEISDKYSGEKTITVMHEGPVSGELFRLTKNRPYWILYGVTAGLDL